MPKSGHRRAEIEMINIKSPSVKKKMRVLLRPRKGHSNIHKQLRTRRLRDNVNNSALAKLRKMLNKARSTMRSTGKGPMRRTARRTARREGRRVARKTARRRKRKNRR